MRLIFFTLFTLTLLNAGGGVLEVDWSSIAKGQQKSSASYPLVLTKGIRNVHLPVYVARSVAHNKNLVVVADTNFYSISLDIAGASLLFEGDKTFQESVNANNPEFQKILNSSSAVEYVGSEGMMTAEFSKHGVNYAITVECEKPKTDKRCTEEGFITSLYGEITMVGGRP